jgi:hypothetical protein
MELICYWVAIISIVPVLCGSLIMKTINYWIESDLEKRKKGTEWSVSREYIEATTGGFNWQPVIIGVIERIIFCIYVGSYSFIQISNCDKVDLPKAIFVAAFYWITLKLALGWKRLVGSEVWKRTLAFNALIQNIVSISVGVLGGWIIKEGKGSDLVSYVWGRGEVGAMFLLIFVIVMSCWPVYAFCLDEENKDSK